MNDEKNMNALSEEDLTSVVGGNSEETNYDDYPCSKTELDDGCRGCICLQVYPFPSTAELYAVCHKIHKDMWIDKHRNISE